MSLDSRTTVEPASSPWSAQTKHGRDLISPTEPDPECVHNLNETVDLLGSGLPTYDYEPAINLDELIERADVVATGTIDQIVRPVPNAGTTISSTNSEMLTRAPNAPLAATTFRIDSLWASGLGPDPLFVAIEGHNLRYVACLSQLIPGGDKLVVNIQGLYIGRARSPSPAIAVIEPLPTDTNTLPIDALATAISDKDSTP